MPSKKKSESKKVKEFFERKRRGEVPEEVGELSLIEDTNLDRRERLNYLLKSALAYRLMGVPPKKKLLDEIQKLSEILDMSDADRAIKGLTTISHGAVIDPRLRPVFLAATHSVFQKLSLKFPRKTIHELVMKRGNKLVRDAWIQAITGKEMEKLKEGELEKHLDEKEIEKRVKEMVTDLKKFAKDSLPNSDEENFKLNLSGEVMNLLGKHHVLIGEVLAFLDKHPEESEKLGKLIKSAIEEIEKRQPPDYW